MAAEKASSWRVCAYIEWKKCQIGLTNKGSNEPHKKVVPFVHKIDRNMPTFSGRNCATDIIIGISVDRSKGSTCLYS